MPWGDSWGRGLVRHTVVVSGGGTCLPSTHEDESPASFLSFLSITRAGQTCKTCTGRS